MGSDDRTARIAGALFISATVASLLSTVFLNPVLNKADYLTKIATNENRVTTGALFLLIGAFASASIAISLYPVLRRHNGGLALGAVGFRLIEGVLYVVAVVSVLSLVTLSQDFVKAGSPALSSFRVSGAVLLAVRDWANLAGVLGFYLGALMYYCVFYRSRLIPRWLSGWGVVGVTLGMAAGMLVLFGVISSMSTGQVVLNLPIGVNEMVLAVWLIVKGLNSSRISSGVPVGAL